MNAFVLRGVRGRRRTTIVGGTVRISRLRLTNFRGWPELVLRPQGHIVLTGVPRGGRTDVVAALMRLLDLQTGRMQPRLADIRQVTPPAPLVASTVGSGGVGGGGSNDAETAAVTGEGAPLVDAEPAPSVLVTRAPYAEVEATLVELGADLEQLCDGFLEPLTDEAQVDTSGAALPDAALGVRVAYRVSYDAESDSLEHVHFFPARSKPDIGQYARVPTSVRRELPVVALTGSAPLQLRADGLLRRLVTDRDPDAAVAAFHTLEQSIAVAMGELSQHPAIMGTVEAALQVGGVARRLGDAEVTSSDVRFQAADGSLSALLRAVHAALVLDEAGALGLDCHGSTAAVVLNVAEALLLCKSAPGAVVVADDFGEGLDAAAAEHLASALRAEASQLWLTTRRPDVVRAFDPEDLVRFARLGGVRSAHAVPPAKDKKEVAIRRLMHAQLLPALTAPTIAITEGPHDLTTYAAVDRRRSSPTLPLSASGVRLVSADNGSGGGTSQIPRVADLAHALGFRVIAIIDCDPAKTSATTLPKIESSCDVVVRLPTGMALEQAIVAGIDASGIRAASAALVAFGVPDPAIGKTDGELAGAIAHFLHSKGLHEQFMDALPTRVGLPLAITAALDAVALASTVEYAGPNRIDLNPPAASP